MSQVRKILVPVDYSRGSITAIREAHRLAQQHSAVVHVLHVWDPPSGFTGFVMPSAMAQEMPSLDLMLRMKAYLETLAAGGIEARGRLERGTPGRTITRLVDSEPYNLVVMGTHVRSGLDLFWPNSVAEYVMRNAACPVLITHMPGSPRRTKQNETRPYV